MGHHGVVDQHQTNALAVLEAQRLGVGELDAIERPGELLHVPGQVQLDRAPGIAAVRVFEGAAQIGVGQHATAVVAQAEARVVEFRRGAHGLHVHQRIVLFAGGVRLHRTHRRVIHARHGAHVHRAVIHPGHAHVVHGHQRARVQRRHRCCQTGAGGEGGAGVTTAIHGLGKQGAGLAVRLDDHVVGLRHGDAQLVDADRFDVQTVCRDHGHFQPRNAHVEVSHGRAVDQPQAQFFA